MAAAGLVAHAANRSGRHPETTLVYPLVCFIALACLGSTTHGIAATYGGLFTMAFVYVGLYGPAGSTLPLAAPAVGAWLLANGILTGPPLSSIVVRLPIMLAIWVSVGLLLSRHAQTTTRTAMLQREVRLDPLTGLPNRRALDDLLAGAAAGDAVVLIDLDYFKTINDELGHPAGDQVLTAFAKILQRSLRHGDVASRFGGDEFLIYLPATALDAVEVVLTRIREQWVRQNPRTTFSAGIAAVRIGRDGTDAFGEADRLLYQAKNAGRSRWARPGPHIPAPNGGGHDQLIPVRP